MSPERSQKEEPVRGERTSDLLVTAAIVVVCVPAYFLLDWFAGWVFDSFPETLQSFLIFVGVLLLLIDCLRRSVNWIERDWQRIQRIQNEERAAKERKSEISRTK